VTDSLHRKVRDICFFSNTSSQASGPTLSHITELSSPGVSGWRVRRATHLHLEPRLRVHTAVLPTPFSSWYDVHLSRGPIFTFIG